MKVLFTGCTFSDKKISELSNLGIFIDNGRVNYSEKELCDILKDYDCYINGGDEICTANVINENKHLKLISFMGTGYQKYIDYKTAIKNNIPVSYTPKANANSVAEYTAALILDAVKKISYSNEEVKNGIWNKYKTFNLEGKTLGIIGMGTIGSKLAKIMCDGFGMKLIYNSNCSKKEIDDKYNTRMISLDEIFEKADIISINATCTENNKGMITDKQLSKMKPNSILINTARAELIKREDFEKNINKINCIAMDGYYDEPILGTDKMISLKNDKFIITPHNAYNSEDALYEMERMLIESLQDVNNGCEIRNKVEI